MNTLNNINNIINIINILVNIGHNITLCPSLIVYDTSNSF